MRKTNLTFLRNTKHNLLVKSDFLNEHYINENGIRLDEIQKNLFKIVCAILGIEANQRGHRYFDERYL